MTWLAAAVAVVRRVEREGHESAQGQILGVDAGPLLLDATERCADDDRLVLP